MKTLIIAKLKAQAKQTGLNCRAHSLKIAGKTWDFLDIRSPRISKQDKILLIAAGIHGEETAGPRTLAKYLPKIVAWAQAAGLKLIIFPLTNPSGHFKKQRYNAINDHGIFGNNDFLIYELANGQIVGGLQQRQPFKRWGWSSDPELGHKLPAETRLFHKLLRKIPWNQVFALIDLHQDFLSQPQKIRAYHYAFQPLKPYFKIIKNISQIIPLWKNSAISAGLPPGLGYQSNNQGFIVRHDGSLGDLANRLGVKHAITVETLGVTPADKAEQTNLIWIKGIIDLLK